MKVFRGIGYELRGTSWILFVRSAALRWGMNVGDIVEYTAWPRSYTKPQLRREILRLVFERVISDYWSAVDGVSWEVHRIKDPTAYKAALAAYQAEG